MSTLPDTPPDNRCRLVLVLDGTQILEMGGKSADILTAALSAGDVASLILVQKPLSETEFLQKARPLVEIAQSRDVAVIIDGETRTAGRLGADGIQFGQDPDDVREGMEKFSPKLMVGAANVRSRHNALVIGELQPDYLMFGKPGGDIRPEPHPKNLDLGEWWSAMVEIPCIVLGGSDVDSVVIVAKSGAEFVALSAAIFAPDDDGKDSDALTVTSAEKVRHANQLLDKHAPSLVTLEN